MKSRLIILFLLITFGGYAQITTDPALPTATKKVTITFDSSKESRLGTYTGDLYTHTGVIVEGSSAWSHVIGTWGDNNVQPKLTNLGNGIYELDITPDINTYYSVTSTEKVTKMAFVFRSADAKKQTNDLFVNVYQEGLVVTVSSPGDNAIFSKNSAITISATSSQDASLKLMADSTTLADSTGKTISASTSFTEVGWNWIIAKATTTEKTVYDSVHIYVKGDVVTQSRPAGVLKGINYPSSTSATLVLWAPRKTYVYVLGDFNNWEVSEKYQMKKDSDYYWLQLDSLTSGQPYVFQYYIDGSLKIADPYTEQTTDPNDQYISSDTYPGLITYPSGKPDGVASVLQPGQTPYSWKISGFTPPSREKLVIYETLIRDFTTDHTYSSLIDKLDYLKNLGINVLELMPVNEFEGNSSWGYNPSFYFAPDKYYGPKDDLKKLVDEAHSRGIAVVLDMVLNHSYGQSPFVKMYWDNANSRPSADNPWYNVQSNFQNPSLQWGYDFNHESVYTRQLVDSINSFWMKQYKVDGFRFDFTLGFSNTPYGPSDWGNEYDAARIANLKRMADEIWKRNSRALIIFEHFADNSELKILDEYNIMLWCNMSGNFGEAAKGNSSDLTWGYFTTRDWKYPNLVTYMESHDEERMMYKCLSNGNSEGAYNIRTLSTALDRMKLSALFMLLYPGPKMIWQFEELGYDYSINTCENPTILSDNCRLSPKPILWSYFDQTNRKEVYKMFGRLNYLKTHYEEFSSSSVSACSLTGMTKWFTFSNGSNNVIAVGNFATSSNSVTLNFPATGTWYDYFQGTGINVSTASQSFTLAPGEYRLYTTRQMTDPFAETGSFLQKITPGNISIYPNPAQNKVTIRSEQSLGTVAIRNLSGQMIFQEDFSGVNEAEINLDKWTPGLYLVQTGNGNGAVPQKLVVY